MLFGASAPRMGSPGPTSTLVGWFPTTIFMLQGHGPTSPDTVGRGEETWFVNSLELWGLETRSCPPFL